MSDNYAQIIIHQIYSDDFSQEPELKFEWRGEPDWPFLVNVQTLHDHPDILGKLPWAVEFVEQKNAWTLVYRRVIKEEGNE